MDIYDTCKCFEILRRYQMKHNPLKCSFRVGSQKLLGFIVNSWQIEANLEKIRALIEISHQPRLRKCKVWLERLQYWASLYQNLRRSVSHFLIFSKKIRNSSELENVSFQSRWRSLVVAPVPFKINLGRDIVQLLSHHRLCT